MPSYKFQSILNMFAVFISLYTAFIILLPVSVTFILITLPPFISQWSNALPVGPVTFVGNGITPVPS